MLLSHTPTGASAPDLIFCAKLSPGNQHQPATRTGVHTVCPHPCGAICPLQAGACASPTTQPSRLALLLSLSATHAQLLAPRLPLTGCLICRN